ncbi:MAG: hypothetical protein ISR91_03415 [Candidatus Delongbacteria bacterium]|nr:hypothetical protein [Candidatus Delongbacteria bacterium]
MKARYTIAVILLLFLLGQQLQADEFCGGTGLFHTQAAELLGAGKLTISSQSRAFAKYIDSPGGKYLLSDGTNVLNATFGFSPHLEIDFSMALYQDLNRTGTNLQKTNVPDDAILRLRWGNYKANYFGRSFLWGAVLKGRLNSSNLSNVYLEPYSSESNAFELGYILSYYDNPLYPQESWNAHFNLAYVNHNDSGSHEKLQLLDGVTQEWQYTLGYRYPTLRWDFTTELYGTLFTNRPDPNIYYGNNRIFSRANYTYLSLGTVYRLFYGISIGFSGDFNLFTSNIEQNNILPEGYPDFYPPWRITGKINILRSTTFSKINTLAAVRPESEIDLEVRSRTGLSQRDLVDWLGTDEEGAEFIDLELEKIRAERKQAELELERLKERLKSRGSE